jgi:hypothetical protein
MSKQIIDRIECLVTPEVAFAVSQDYDRRLDWDPFLSIARVIGDSAPGKGVRTYCQSKSGIGMETEYVSFDPPKTAAVRMTRGPFYFRNFAASWRFRDVGDSKSEIIFTYSFELQPVLKPATFLVTAILRREMRKRLEALSLHLRTKVNSVKVDNM